MRSHARASVAVAVLCAFLAFAAAAASAAYKEVGTFANNPAEANGSGSGDGQLSDPNQIDVNDATGKLYVADTGNNRVEVFKPTASAGEYDSQVAISEPTGLAIDQSTGDVYVANASGIAKYDSSLNPIPVGWTDPAVSGTLAVDPSTGDLLVADQANSLIRRFESDGTPVSTFAAERPIDVAANSSGEVLVVTSTGDIISECFFGVTSSVQRFSAAGVAEGVVGSFEFPGAIAVDPDDDSIVVATHVAGYNCPGSNPAVAFLDSTGTEVESVELPYQYGFVPGVSAAGNDSFRVYAVVRSPINDSYVSTRIAVLEEPQPAAPVATTGGAPYVTASSVRFTGTVDPNLLATTYWLEYGPSSAYGSRFPLAHDAEAGNGEGPKNVSLQVEGLAPQTTYHYRLVAKNSLGETPGADMTVTTEPAAPPPPADRAYELVSPVDKGGNPVSQNNGANTAIAQASVDGDRLFYSARGAFRPGDPAGYLRTIYAADRGSDGWSSRGFEAPTPPSPQLKGSTVVMTSVDGSHSIIESNGILAAGAVEGRQNLYVRANAGGHYVFVATIPDGAPPVIDAADDLSSFVFAVEASLTPDAPPGVNNIYEWSAGTLRLINYMPDGIPPAAGAQPRPFEASGRFRANFGSDDGTRVFFEAEVAPLTAGVFLRENANRPPSPLDAEGNCAIATDACTVAISVSQRSGDTDQVQNAIFQAASADGRFVYFTSEADLTESSNTHGSHSLYRFDVDLGELTDLTVTDDPAGAGVGRVLGVSEDGSSAYFLADSVLGPGATRGDCGGSLGICNIWVWHQGQVQFVGALEEGEALSSFSVSPSGRYFAFLSASNGLALTGQDTSGAACPPGDPACAEVFVYDAEENQIDCASCPSNGAEPTASAVLGEGAFAEGKAVHYRRLVLDDGTVFFDSPDPLVASDSNGSFDVYEWRAGERRLISPGDAAYPAHFGDASADGGSVFFTTPESLVARDVDSITDFYVARRGGGFAEPPAPPPPCLGEACQGQPAFPATQPTPGSVSFNGQSNRKARSHSKKSKHGKKHQRKNKKKHQKKHHNRSAKHNRGGAK